MGRPRKEIDQKQFENLCALQCTLEEMCSFFDVCSDTLEAWCKRVYRMQWRLAEKNASMAIWLGKQHLGQRDVPGVTIDAAQNASSVEREPDALTKALREEAEMMDNADQS